MAKKGGSGKTYTSKGERSSVKKSTRNAVRRDYMQSLQRVINQQNALSKGKDIVLTIENPNKTETNKRFIKVKVSGKEYLRTPKSMGYIGKGVD